MAKPTTAASGVDRRTFLRVTAAGSMIAAGCGSEPAQPTDGPSQPSADSPVPPASTAAGFELDELTVTDLQQRLQSGELTSRSLAEKYLSRIAGLDQDGPTLRAVLETNPEALDQADALDRERMDGRVRGPLHGIPIILKDNIDTIGPMMTTAGSLALEGWIPPRDAFIVSRLREAGVLVLAKANLSEWANFRSTRSSSGWSGRGGQCRNPFALDRNPSGSSSGTGAAISANYAALGIGTETDGSIVSPANNCGLVGVKPTVGLVSRTGIIPIAESQDTAGPMTRTVRDAALLLSVIAGVDEDDEATAEARQHLHADYTQFLDANGLKGTRIGVPRKRLFGYSQAADRVAEDAIKEMAALGATIVDPADIETLGTFGDAEFEVLLYEFKDGLNRYLARQGAQARVKTLEALIAWNEEHRSREMPYFGQEILEMAEKKGPLTEAAYRKALADCRTKSRTRGIDAVMVRHRLDALVCPTSGPAWLTDLVNGDYGSGGSSSAPAVAGYPHITLPGGEAFGLPIGVSFIGRAWSEPTLFKLAYAYEQATKHRRAPRFLLTADL